MTGAATTGEPSTDALLSSAIASESEGDIATAEHAYRTLLARAPRHAIANHNLGNLMLGRGDTREAIALLRSALQAEPQQNAHWLSYAKALRAGGHPREAALVIDRARQSGFSGAGFDALEAALLTEQAEQDPVRMLTRAEAQGDARLAARAATALAAYNDVAGAIAACRRALAIDPDLPEVHFQLGSLLSENGCIAEGFAHFMRRAWLVRSSDDGATGNAGELPHKRKHDREQRAFLDAMGAGGDTRFRLADGSRLAGHAVNPANATAALADRWQAAAPPFLVIDDFLTPVALEKLRAYCAGSTIWHRVYEAGYIGATLEDGLAAPLMAQIAEEIAMLFPAIFDAHPFRYAGAFKYDSAAAKGTNTHADFSAINVNFYITPDEANLDPASGGLEIWDVVLPDEATMRRINSDEAEARAFLERSGAARTIVPHRANRAIFFRSGLVHRTDRYVFAEGYLNQRINVSLLYGRFGG